MVTSLEEREGGREVGRDLTVTDNVSLMVFCYCE